jgi:hypothetical protein
LRQTDNAIRDQQDFKIEFPVVTKAPNATQLVVHLNPHRQVRVVNPSATVALSLWSPHFPAAVAEPTSRMAIRLSLFRSGDWQSRPSRSS